MAKVAYFENGRVHDVLIRQLAESVEPIPILNALTVNLLKYDVVIIPSYANQDIMSKLTRSLVRFVHLGGILVILGATEDKCRWLPYCKHNPRFLDSINLRNTKTQEVRDIIGALDYDALRFHDKFVTHGYLSCEHRSHTAVIVGEDDDKKLVMGIIRPSSGGGKLLVTTLDPDYHGASGYARDRQEVNEHARKLFNNIAQWAISEVRSVHSLIRISRMIARFPLLTCLRVLKYLSVLGCTILFLLFITSRIPPEVFNLWAGTASISALVLTVLFGVIRKE